MTSKLAARAIRDEGAKSNRMQPIVTIITVTYNRSRILPLSIDSVLSQDYANLRLLIVDDASTDGTASLLKRYEEDPRVEVLRHCQNQGVTGARNTALAHLTNDVVYFGYNDSDDTLLRGAVSRAVAAIEAHGSRYSMVYAAAIDAETGEPQGAVFGRDGTMKRSGEITFDDYLGERVSGDAFQLVRRELLGDLRHEARADGGEGVLWARILRANPALLLDDVLQSKDRSGADRVLRYRYNRAAAEGRMWTLRHKLRHPGKQMQRAYPQNYAKLLRSVSLQAAMAGDSRLARATSRQALRVERSLRGAAVIILALCPGRAVLEANRVQHALRRRLGGQDP